MLTDTACRNAKPGERDRKIADSGGLYLLVRKSGVKVWNWKYRFAGKEKRLTIGRYPDVKLGEARRRRDEARSELEQGLDPSAEKRRKKTRASADTSFRSVARSWHAQKSKALANRYAGQIMDRLEADVFPLIGADPIDEITPPMALEVVRRIEERGSHEMAHRVRMHMSDVFVWGIASGLCTQDPAAVIRKALAPTNPQLRPAATKLKDARAVIEKTEQLTDIYWATRMASRLLALTAARPGVVRRAERSEFEELDGPSPVWRIPATKMKLNGSISLRKNTPSAFSTSPKPPLFSGMMATSCGGVRCAAKRLRRTYGSEETARRAARSASRKMDRAKAEFSINLALGRPELFPEKPLTLAGFKPEIDAQKWLIGECRHTLSGSGGLVSELTLEAK